ncbi:MAG: DUF2059 domain-containing protein [Saprospiraceae bacterium]|nr:DUF2059 domain-containing protein [Saprospiraceae bacterium]
MKKLLLATALCLMAVAAFSQTTTKTAQIRKLLELSGSGKMGVMMMDNLLPALKNLAPDAPADFWEEVQKEVHPEDIVELVVPIYDKYYTEEDIRQLIVFYESPVGQKMVAQMPAVMQESMAVGQEWGREIAEKVISRLEEKGYKKH